MPWNIDDSTKRDIESLETQADLDHLAEACLCAADMGAEPVLYRLSRCVGRAWTNDQNQLVIPLDEWP